MPCCGKKIQKLKNIAIGFANLAAGKKYEFTDARIRTCRACDESTWLTAAEYYAWLKTRRFEMRKLGFDLEKLPPLPKYPQSKKRRRLYCRLCKCFIPAKARVAGESCRLGKWADHERESGTT